MFKMCIAAAWFFIGDGISKTVSEAYFVHMHQAGVSKKTVPSKSFNVGTYANE
jgi:hypothetical protein